MSEQFATYLLVNKKTHVFRGVCNKLITTVASQQVSCLFTLTCSLLLLPIQRNVKLSSRKAPLWTFLVLPNLKKSVVLGTDALTHFGITISFKPSPQPVSPTAEEPKNIDGEVLEEIDALFLPTHPLLCEPSTLQLCMLTLLMNLHMIMFIW